jgi:murein DD-endopeptidase MepM/ murein hydrolase activator NlpD
VPASILPHRVRTLAALVALLVLFAVSAPGGSATADTQSQLNSAHARLASLLKQIKAAHAREAVLQNQMNALAAKISQVQTELAKTMVSIAKTQAAIQQTQAGIQAQQATLDDRARLVYEQGPGSTLEFALGASSFANLQDRIEMLDAAAQSDQNVIDDLTNEKMQLHARQVDLQKQQAEEQQQQSKLQQQQAALNAKFVQAESLVKGVKHKIAQARKLVHHLTQQQIGNIGFPVGGGGPAIGGVLLTCPVRGPHAYTDDFGAPRPGHIHAGVDIQAGTGTPIVAPFPGRVAQSWDPGGGNDVYVYGKDGYAFNAHLSAYGATGHVSTGTVIGYVGSTGDATGPHDHFEWHPNVIPPHPYKSAYGYTVVGTAIDAFPYLNSVC